MMASWLYIKLFRLKKNLKKWRSLQYWCPFLKNVSRNVSVINCRIYGVVMHCILIWFWEMFWNFLCFTCGWSWPKHEEGLVCNIFFELLRTFKVRTSKSSRLTLSKTRWLIDFLGEEHFCWWLILTLSEVTLSFILKS